MALVMSTQGIKGGVSKTTLIRLLAAAYAAAQWKIATIDIDTGQVSLLNWNKRRLHYGHEPIFPVISGNVNTIRDLKASDEYHLILADGAAYGSLASEQIAQLSDMVIIPTRFSLDDMEAAVALMNGLVIKGIPKERLAVVFAAVPEQRSDAPYLRAKAYMEQTGYYIVPGFIEMKNSFTDAQNEGLSIGEVQYGSLRQKVDIVLQGLFDRFAQLTAEK